MQQPKSKAIPDDHLIALVTGANGAIGKAIATQLARLPSFEVVIACRDEAKAAKTLQEIVSNTKNPNVRYEIVDVSSKSSIHSLAARWRSPLHVLINNAAVTPRRLMETTEGIELQFATNVLGYFWMIQAFLEILKDNAPARVINVASYWAGDMDITDLEFKRRAYNNNHAYRQSKQANRMLTVAYARRLESQGITVNACHPGDVNSKLSNDLGFGGHESAEEGARTPVWLATSSIGEEVTGKYFENLQQVHCRFADNIPLVEQLYEICLQY